MHTYNTKNGHLGKNTRSLPLSLSLSHIHTYMESIKSPASTNPWQPCYGCAWGD